MYIKRCVNKGSIVNLLLRRIGLLVESLLLTKLASVVTKKARGNIRCEITELSPQCFSDFWQVTGHLDLITLN